MQGRFGEFVAGGLVAGRGEVADASARHPYRVPHTWGKEKGLERGLPFKAQITGDVLLSHNLEKHYHRGCSV